MHEAGKGIDMMSDQEKFWDYLKNGPPRISRKLRRVRMDKRTGKQLIKYFFADFKIDEKKLAKIKDRVWERKQ